MFITITREKIIVFFLAFFCFITSLFIFFVLVEGYAPNDALKETSVKVPIVMYHHFLKNSSQLGKYVINPQEFENDLKYIQENGFTTIVMQDLIDYVYSHKPLPDKPIMITIDDGYASSYVYAYPLLKQYNMKSILSIIGRYTDLYTQTTTNNFAYSHVTWDNLKEMSNSNVIEIQNHSYNMHTTTSNRVGMEKKRNEKTESYQQLLYDDLKMTQDKVFSCLGKEPTCFTYPFGQVNKESKDVLDSLGIKASLSCAEGISTVTYDPNSLIRLKRFNRPHKISTNSFFKKVLKKY